MKRDDIPTACGRSWGQADDHPRRGHRFREMGVALHAVGFAACLSMPSAMAQAAPAEPDQPATLPEVVISTPAGNRPVFQIAGSADRVDGDQLREDRLQIHLSESLGAVPGVLVQNRQNLAQDLQLSVRGFGARSTFGVRGVRLYVDGIPATLPDGQGQTSNIDIGSADRIEVLRGPFSALYGNSSGGVLQVFTEDGAGPPKLNLSLAGGSFGTGRTGFKLSGGTDQMGYVISASRFHTDGWRAHSAADRDLFNAKFHFNLGGGSRLTLVANHVNIRAQDPLGLSAEQLADNPRGAALAQQFNTRKSVDQSQLGLRYEIPINADHQLQLMAYGGQRRTVQYQSIPVAVQQNPLHAGGVFDLDRTYSGLDLRWLGRATLAGRPFTWAAGLAYDDLREQRRGFENYLGPTNAPLLGERGRLRRDERNRARNLDPYLQASWQLAERWRVEGGVRRADVRFASDDRYITASNGDDSQSARYRRWLPTAALRFEASPALALYAAAGRGFETPTLNELAYRAGGAAGANFGLQPASSTSLELGLKARLGGGLLTAALFQTGTKNEIVTLTNVGGRSTFQNAGRTRRRGAELSWLHETRQHWRTQLAYTWIDARYRDAFCSPTPCTPASQVAAGNRLPGIPRHSLFAALGWMPPQGWHAGAELRVLSRVYANDSNRARAPGYLVTALHAGYTRRIGPWDLNAFARVDNLFDRRTIGSVIINEGNGRFFEPAPGRNWTVGVNASYQF